MYAGKVKRFIAKLDKNVSHRFCSIEIEGLSTENRRQILRRLHAKGVITIGERACFIIEEEFSEILFVYGSLKKGFDNNNIIKKYAKRLGKATTSRKLGMFEDSFGNYPFLTYEPHLKIDGELWEIHRKDLLDRIDEFEGAPDYYQRVKINVKTHKGIKKAFAYIQVDANGSGKKPLKSWENNTEYKNNEFMKMRSNEKNGCVNYYFFL